MIKKIFLSLFFSLSATFLFSYTLTPISNQDSLSLAENWLALINKIPFPDKAGLYSLKAIETVEDNGIPLAEVYHLSPKGYILISCYREMVPIKSFSLTSSFNLQSEGYEKAVLLELQASLNILTSYKPGLNKNLEQTLQANKEEWDKMINLNLRDAEISPVFSASSETNNIHKFLLKTPSGINIEVVTAFPLLKTKWSQRYPFNKRTPKIKGEKTPTGCVATAMAQIMRYYRWPKKGEGSHSYTWGQKKLKANFSDPFAWKHMPYETTDYDTQKEEKAVAELCYEAGVAVEMDYSPSGSSSSISMIVQALKEYFKYQGNIELVLRSNTENYTEWFEILKSQREINHPVAFSMRGDKRGHVGVMDGYLISNKSKKIHLNMGWNGNHDAYYDMDNILDYTNNAKQKAVINIIPSKTKVYPPLNFTCYIKENRTVFQVEYINVLSWKPNIKNKNIILYRIYLKNANEWYLIKELDSQTFEYWHRGVLKDRIYEYAISAVNSEYKESPFAYAKNQ